MKTRAEGNVWSRAGFLIENDSPKGECPYLSGCNYVKQQREFSTLDKVNYIFNICGKYHGACEKNLDSCFSRITKLSGEEVHELLK